MSSSIAQTMETPAAHAPPPRESSVNAVESPREAAQPLSPDLALDCSAAAERIGRFVQGSLRKLNRRGCVLGVSDGGDSAVYLHLGVRAIGQNRALTLLMPERESSKHAGRRARRLCEELGVRYIVEDISQLLGAIVCYERRDATIRTLFPDYGSSWRQKIVISVTKPWTPYFNIVAQRPTGKRLEQRPPADAYLQIVAATNFKQRARKSVQYCHAERLNYAVIGTPNQLEHELGFFVRDGDSLADVKPIAHLYKTQVYALAEYLDVAKEIHQQSSSTGTYSPPQTRDQFFFALSYSDADLVLCAMILACSDRHSPGAIRRISSAWYLILNVDASRRPEH
jgi:NAD+ synthase